MHRSLPLAAFVLALASACAGPSFQAVPRPDEHSAVAADRTRVYIARDDDVRTKLRQLEVVDDGVSIGRLGDDEFLVWDRPSRAGVGQIFYEGVDPGYSRVEAPFELPRDPGATAYLVVRIGKLKKPEVAVLSSEEGRALMATRKPAPTK